jgi:transposase/DNA replication protein DnaC
MKSPDDVVDALHRLGIRADDSALRALLNHLTKSRASPVESLEQLVALERRERDARNLASRTKHATLGAFKPLDQFDWDHPRSIDRGLYEDLLELRFLEHGENILFRGQSGVGKTNLAQNLALTALQKGHTVRFTTLAAALADLSRQESLPALERRLRRYTNVDFLLLDELGYLPCDSRSADLLYTLISRRHEQRSTSSQPTSPTNSGAPSFPAPPALPHSSTDSTSTATSSRSMPNPGATRRPIPARARSPRVTDLAPFIRSQPRPRTSPTLGAMLFPTAGSRVRSARGTRRPPEMLENPCGIPFELVCADSLTGPFPQQMRHLAESGRRKTPTRREGAARTLGSTSAVSPMRISSAVYTGQPAANRRSLAGPELGASGHRAPGEPVVEGAGAGGAEVPPGGALRGDQEGPPERRNAGSEADVAGPTTLSAVGGALGSWDTNPQAPAAGRGGSASPGQETPRGERDGLSTRDIASAARERRQRKRERRSRRARLILRLKSQGRSNSSIALELGCDPKTIRRLLKPKARKKKGKGSLLDPFRPLIRKLVLEDELTAERVLEEIRAIGYRGAYTILKEYIRTFRPKSMQRAHERFETAPGEQAQVDLSSYTVMLGLTPTKVVCFSMVFGFSRWQFIHFLLHADARSVSHCHVMAFEEAGGIPVEILYDRTKQVVIESFKEGVVFHPVFGAMVAHYERRSQFRTPPITDSRGADHLRVTLLRPRKSALRRAKASFRGPKKCLGRKRRQGDGLRDRLGRNTHKYSIERRTQCPDGPLTAQVAPGRLASTWSTGGQRNEQRKAVGPSRGRRAPSRRDEAGRDGRAFRAGAAWDAIRAIPVGAPARRAVSRRIVTGGRRCAVAAVSCPVDEPLGSRPPDGSLRVAGTLGAFWQLVLQGALPEEVRSSSYWTISCSSQLPLLLPA